MSGSIRVAVAALAALLGLVVAQPAFSEKPPKEDRPFLVVTQLTEDQKQPLGISPADGCQSLPGAYTRSRPRCGGYLTEICFGASVGNSEVWAGVGALGGLTIGGYSWWCGYGSTVTRFGFGSTYAYANGACGANPWPFWQHVGGGVGAGYVDIWLGTQMSCGAWILNHSEPIWVSFRGYATGPSWIIGAS